MAFIKAFSRFTQYFPSSLKKDKINQVGKIKQILRYNSLSKENVSVNELMRPFLMIFTHFTSLQVGVLASALKAL